MNSTEQYRANIPLPPYLDLLLERADHGEVVESDVVVVVPHVRDGLLVPPTDVVDLSVLALLSLANLKRKRRSKNYKLKL